MVRALLVPVVGAVVVLFLRFAFFVRRARTATPDAKSRTSVPGHAGDIIEPSTATPSPGPARTARPPAPVSSPARALLEHDQGEHRYHGRAIKTARLLRAAGAQEAAAAELEHERLREARMAADLKRILASNSPSFAQRVEQSVLDAYKETLRVLRLAHRPMDRPGVPRVPRVPQPSPGLRFRAWLGRGSRTGTCQLLVEYHTRQFQHYQLACIEAHQHERENAQDEARARIEAEICWHLDMSYYLNKLQGSLPRRQPGRK